MHRGAACGSGREPSAVFLHLGCYKLTTVGTDTALLSI